jgi:hypothetical protein
MRAARQSEAGEATGVGPTSNGAAGAIAYEQPYVATVSIEGTRPLLFHAWNSEAVDEKAGARKGSAAKKTDNVESYVHRDEEGYICLPGAYLCAAFRDTARFKQDPRSTRKSMVDLFKTNFPVDELYRITSDKHPRGVKTWDMLHRGRVVVQRNGVTRSRPCFLAGWRVTVKIAVSCPEYISPALLNEVAVMAGRLNGLCDGRPSYGRFNVTNFSTSEF